MTNRRTKKILILVFAVVASAAFTSFVLYASSSGWLMLVPNPFAPQAMPLAPTEDTMNTNSPSAPRAISEPAPSSTTTTAPQSPSTQQSAPPGFKGPTSPPHVNGPTSPPPNY